MAKIDYGKYLGLGLGAAAMPVLANQLTFLSGLLSNQFMAYGFMGVTVGSVLLAAVGVGVVDQFMNK